VKIGDGQEIRLPGRHPGRTGHGLALGTVPVPTGIIGNPFKAADTAAFHMAAQCRSSARLQGVQDFLMRPGLRRDSIEGGSILSQERAQRPGSRWA